MLTTEPLEPHHRMNASIRQPGRQLPLPLAPVTRTGEQPFFAADSNQAALAWLDTPQAWPEGRLLLWGEAGTGKTHLLHRWARAAGEACLDGAALRWPVDGAARGGVVAVDDADLAPEEALLHLLNQAAEQRRPVLLAARSPASAWPTHLADLASRLRATLAVRIEPAEDSLLRAVLRRVLADRQLLAPEPVQEWLLLILPRTPAALEEAAARLDRASLATGGRITRALAGAIVDEMAAMWHARMP